MKLARSAHPEATEKQLQATALEHFMCGLSDLTLQERLHNRDDIVSLNTAIVAANNYQKKEAVLASMRTTQGSSMAMAACQTKPPSRRVADTQGHNSKEMISVIDELKKEVKELQMQLQGAKAGEHRAGKEQGCYQCGNITHFKRDCPILGRSRQQEAQPAAGARPKRQGEDQPHCEGCDRKGHWLSECWRTPTAAGGAGRRRTVQNAQCLGCGRQGHWMAECWRISAASRSREPWQQTE